MIGGLKEVHQSSDKPAEKTVKSGSFKIGLKNQMVEVHLKCKQIFIILELKLRVLILQSTVVISKVR